MRNRARMLTASHQPSDMRHVDEQNRTDRIGNLAQPRKIDRARIGGRAGSDHNGPYLLCLFLQRVVIDLLGLFIDAVVCDLVISARAICWMSVGSMTATRDVHGEAS